MIYISRPSAVEAVQWDGNNRDEVQAFGGDKVIYLTVDGSLQLQAGVDGVQKWVPVPVGHWLCRRPGDASDMWPVGPEYFADKYRPIAGEIRPATFPH